LNSRGFSLYIPKYHKLGIGTEAVTMMCNWCFLNTELKTIWVDVDKDNIASIRMLEKSGFNKVKEIENGKMVSTICDYCIYELYKPI